MFLEQLIGAVGSGKRKGKGLSKSVVAGKVPQSVIPLVTSQNGPVRGKGAVVFILLLVHLWFSTWGDSSPRNLWLSETNWEKHDTDGWRPGMLLSFLQCTGQHLTPNNYLSPSVNSTQVKKNLVYTSQSLVQGSQQDEHLGSHEAFLVVWGQQAVGSESPPRVCECGSSKGTTGSMGRTLTGCCRILAIHWCELNQYLSVFSNLMAFIMTVTWVNIYWDCKHFLSWSVL